MPINKANYPSDWDEISKEIRLNRAHNRCEGSPNHYPDCRVHNRLPHPITGSIVMLTTAHLDHDPTNNDHDNLRVLCQRCHLAHDQKQRIQSAARTRRRKKMEAGQLSLW